MPSYRPIARGISLSLVLLALGLPGQALAEDDDLPPLEWADPADDPDADNRQPDDRRDIEDAEVEGGDTSNKAKKTNHDKASKSSDKASKSSRGAGQRVADRSPRGAGVDTSRWMPSLAFRFTSEMLAAERGPIRATDGINSLWVGAAYMPTARTGSSLFVAGGLAFDMRSMAGSVRTTDVIPCVKFGYAWFLGAEQPGDDTLTDFWNYFPVTNFYGIAGILPYARGMLPAFRLGVGVQLPILAPVIGFGYAGLFALFRNIEIEQLPLVPNGIEVIYQQSVDGSADLIFSWGLGI